MPKITFIKNGKSIVIDTDNTDQTLLQICQENDIEMETACGGNGVCTTCLVNVKEGKENLNEYTLQEDMMLGGSDDMSMRLGCQCKANDDCTVELAY